MSKDHLIGGMLWMAVAFSLSCVIVLPEFRSGKLMIQKPEEQLRMTMGEEKTIGTTLETYDVDYSNYPPLDCAMMKGDRSHDADR